MAGGTRERKDLPIGEVNLFAEHTQNVDVYIFVCGSDLVLCRAGIDAGVIQRGTNDLVVSVVS